MEVSQTNNPFTGEGWEGWQDYIGLEPGSALRRGNWAIQRNGWLTCRDQLIGTFPTPESARAVAEIIEAAVAGQAIPSRKDVAELVEIGASLCAQLEENWENPSGALVLLAEIKEKYAL